MVVQTRLDTMYQIRQSGISLDQVGSHFGITRERARQLLTKHYGSTRIQDLLTAAELARLAGCSHNYISKLRRRGVIQPAMVIGHRRSLWRPETIATIIIYADRHRCPICQQALPSDRWVFCSQECRLKARRQRHWLKKQGVSKGRMKGRKRDGHRPLPRCSLASYSA